MTTSINEASADAVLGSDEGPSLPAFAARQLRSDCLNFAMRGCEGWAETAIIKRADAFEAYIREGVKNVAGPDEGTFADRVAATASELVADYADRAAGRDTIHPCPELYHAHPDLAGSQALNHTLGHGLRGDEVVEVDVSFLRDLAAEADERCKRIFERLAHFDKPPAAPVAPDAEPEEYSTVCYLVAPVSAGGEGEPINREPYRFVGSIKGNGFSWAECVARICAGKGLLPHVVAWRIYRREAPIEFPKGSGTYLDLGYGLLAQVPSQCLSFVDDGMRANYSQRPKGIPGPASIDPPQAA